MKKSYYLSDAKQLERVLGTNSTVEVTKRCKKSYGDGTLCKSVRVRRVEERLIEVSVRDFDGCQFRFQVNPKTEIGRLISPCLDKCSYEGLLLGQLWYSVSDMLRQRHK